MPLPVAVGALFGPNSLVVGIHHNPNPVPRSRAELARGDAELAQVVRDRRVIPEPGKDLAVGPERAAEAAAEELVRHHAIVGQPQRMRTHHGARSTQRVDARVQVELLVELVTEKAVQRGLIRGHHGPGGDLVAQLLRIEPALEVNHRAVELDVASRVDRSHVAEVIGEFLFRGSLVDVANQRIRAQCHLPFLSAIQTDAVATGVERTPGRSLRVLQLVRCLAVLPLLELRRLGVFHLPWGQRPTQPEFAFASFGDPYALSVIAPGVAQKTRCTPEGTLQSDPAGDICLAIGPFSARRAALEDLWRPTVQNLCRTSSARCPWQSG